MFATLFILAVIRPESSLGSDFELGGARPVDFPRPNVAQLLQGPVAVLAFTTLAVAIVRWIPTWLVIVPTPFFLLVQLAFFGLFLGTATNAANWLGVGGLLAHGVVNGEWVGCGEFDARCDLPVSGFDRVTLYRVLEWLVDNGLAHRVTDAQRVFRFSAADDTAKGHASHAHFRCEVCARVF